jgi:hypothetical protein
MRLLRREESQKHCAELTVDIFFHIIQLTQMLRQDSAYTITTSSARRYGIPT